MKPEIVALPHFDRRLKRLTKKYRDLTKDLRKLETLIGQNPHLGINLGAGLYKIRLASKSKGKAKAEAFGL